MAQDLTVPIDFPQPGPPTLATLPGDPVSQTGFTSPLGTVGTGDQLFFASVQALYQKYLGRPATADDITKWANGTYGATDLAGIEDQIKNSDEAKRRAGGSSGGSSGGDSSDLMTRIKNALSAAQSTDDPQYWFDRISADPNGAGSAWGYWLDRINRGDGALAVRNGTLSKFQDSSGGTGGVLGASGGPPPGTLQDYGVPTTPYQSQPWTGGNYTPPPLPASLQTPYVAPTWQGGAFKAPDPYTLSAAPGAFVPPTPNDALRTGHTYDPTQTAALPHFATGVQDFSGGNAVVGEQGPEVVNLPPGSSVTPTWASFYAPSAADMQNDPGYQERLRLDQQARERSAAAQGSILSGGTQLALGRAAQDYASNEYQNVFNRALATHGQNVSDYQNQFNDALASQQQNFGQWATGAGLGLQAQNQDFNQALAQYQANYGQFLDAAQLGLQARNQNENEYLNNQLAPSQYGYTNQYQQYLQDNARTLNDYLTNYGINRTGVQDFLTQQNKTADRGLQAVYYGRPSGA